MQVDDPVDAAYFPAAQTAHLAAVACARAVSPASKRDFPTGQDVQALDADTAAYLPAAQLAQAVAPVPPTKVPTAQLAQEDAADALNFPATQTWH